jgi:hypothetical protein
MKRSILVAAILLPAIPALAQAREYCVERMPYGPLAPDTRSRLIIYQAYAVPTVRQGSTVIEYRTQLRNRSSGTINVSVNLAILTAPPGARFAAGPAFQLRSNENFDVGVAALIVNGQTATVPVEAWGVIERLFQSCPFTKTN